MDGRRPSGLMWTNTDVDAPHKRDEYLRWYLRVHFPEVMAPGIFTHPRMFLNARVPPPEGELPFLALYETSWIDVEQAALAFEQHVQELFAARRIHAGTVGGLYAIYAQRANASCGAGRLSQSLVALHWDARSGREAALERWAVDELVPASRALGLFHTFTFYERQRGEAFAKVTRPDAPRFLALFESDRGDPGFLAARLESKAGAVPPELATPRGVGCFYRGPDTA